MVDTEEAGTSNAEVEVEAGDSAGKVDRVGEAMSWEEAAMEAAEVNDEATTGTWFGEEVEGRSEGNEVWGCGSIKGKTEDEEGDEDEQQWPESGPTPLQEAPRNIDFVLEACSSKASLTSTPSPTLKGDLEAQGVRAVESKAEEQQKSKEIEEVVALESGPPTSATQAGTGEGSGLN